MLGKRQGGREGLHVCSHGRICCYWRPRDGEGGVRSRREGVCLGDHQAAASSGLGLTLRVEVPQLDELQGAQRDHGNRQDGMRSVLEVVGYERWSSWDEMATGSGALGTRLRLRCCVERGRSLSPHSVEKC